MFIEVHTGRTLAERKAVLINIDQIESVIEVPRTYNEAEYTKICMRSGDVISTYESYANVKNLITNTMWEAKNDT